MSNVDNNLILNSVISPVTCKVNDIVTYMIQITVPEGMIAYNIKVKVSYLNSLQQIIENSFSFNGTYLTTQPTIENGEIIFPKINSVDASDESVTMVYMFKAKVLNAYLPVDSKLNVYSNSVDEQLSNITFDWSNNLAVAFNEQVTDTAKLYVELPYITLEYKQRNVTTGGSFTTNQLTLNIGDTIEYRIIAINNGKAEFNNLVVIDKLLSILKLDISSFQINLGSYKLQNNNSEIIWTIPNLSMGQIAYITFKAEMLPSISTLNNIQTSVKGQYNISPTNTQQVVSNFLTLINEGASFIMKANSTTATVGSEIEYTIIINIFKGVIVSNFQVYDILPLTQKYVNGLTQQINLGPITPIQPILSNNSNNEQIVRMPQITQWGKPGYINVTENTTIIYKFNAKDMETINEYPYYLEAINNAYMSWDTTGPNGIESNKTSTSCKVVITTPKVTVLKESFIEGSGNTYSQNEIFISAGNIVNYKLTVTCGGSSPSLNVVVTDALEPCFLFKSNVSTPTEGSIKVPSVGSGGTIQWTIPKMSPGQVLVYEYSVTVSNSVSLDEQYISAATATYYSSSSNAVMFTATSNQLLVIINGLPVTYSCNQSVMYFGQIAKYTIKITIPKGITVYDLKVACLLTQGYQYVTGSWTSTMTPLGTPTVSGEGILQYSEPNTVLNGQKAELNIIYTYQIKLTSFVLLEPYTQLQDNVCNVNWLNSQSSHVINTSIANCLVRINGSNINCVKQQRNVTNGQTQFTQESLQIIKPGDKIDYELTINNNGYATAYDVVVSDLLPLQYISAEPYSVTVSGGSLTWNVGNMQVSNEKSLIVHCVVPSSYKTGSPAFNTFSCTFANSLGSDMIGENFSNTVGVEVNVPIMNSYFQSSIIDTSSQVGVTYNKVQGTTVLVGQKVPYYIEVQIPPNTTVYNVIVTSTLTGNEEYTPNSLGGAGTIVSASAQEVVINFGKILEGGVNGLNLISYYDITITQSSNQQNDIQSIMEQNNILTWDINAQGLPGVQANSYNYLISTSFMLQLKFLQGFTVDTLSQNPITITSVGEEIYYQIQVTNTSNSPMYNVEVYNNFQSNIKVQNITNIEFESVSGVIPAEKFILVRPLGGSTIDGMMPVLNGGEVVIITLLCKVLAPIIPGETVQNQISSYYSTSLANLYGVQFGVINSNILEFTVPTDIVKMNLVAIPSTIEVGNIVDYNLQIVIPVGLKLFNCAVKDNFPTGQKYLSDIQPTTMAAVSQNNSDAGTLLLQQTIINTEIAGKTLNYKYSALVNQPGELGNLSSEGILQLNQVFMNWGINSTAPTNSQISASCTVNVISPYISIIGEQQIVGGPNVFYQQKAEIMPYEYLFFKISVENTGQAIAYNLNINCKLDEFVKYIGPVQDNVGTLSFNDTNNSINWIIPSLGLNKIVTVTFKVQMQEGAPATYVTQNELTGNFGTTNLPDANKYGVVGNTLEEQYPEIVVSKSAVPISPTVGNKINYTITVDVPPNVNFYNLKVCDVLPVGQVYDSSIVPTVNGEATTVIINGQQICFEPIKNITISNSPTNFQYNFTAMLEKKEEIDVENKQNNLTYIGWFRNSALTQPAVPQENNINVNIIDNLVTLNKYQSNYNLSNGFTQGVIYASANDVAVYKIEVTNNSNNTIDNLQVQDNLDSNLQFLQLETITVGQVNLSMARTGVIKWAGITTLAPGTSIKIIYTAKILNFNNTNIIENQAIENIINSSGKDVSGNIYSNIVKVKNLDTLFSFIPSKNNYVTPNKAISYGVLGCSGNITYVLKNVSSIFQKFLLNISSMPINYNIFINGVFIQEVYANTTFNSQLQELSRVGAGESIYVSLKYKINEKFEVYAPIHFNITATIEKTKNFITINNNIYLGKVLMNLKYQSKEYIKNPSMYSINYEVTVTITKNIKVYDLQLKAFYPPSCILENSQMNGKEAKVFNVPGVIIYPTLVEENATNQDVTLTFNYTVLQYKNTPLGVGELEKAGAILSIRTSRNMENKCVFKVYANSSDRGEKYACLCIDNVLGKCAQYYKYDNVSLPQVTGYKFKNIIFGNPQINEGTLNISPSECGHNFNKISYSFTVPYTIIYEMQGCSSVKTSTKAGVLPSRNIESVVYVGDNVITQSNIITGVEVQCTDYNTSYTEANVCLAIITYSVSKKGVLIKNEERQEVLKCCTNCNNTNNDKQLN